jgi:hypothetical protein
MSPLPVSHVVGPKLAMLQVKKSTTIHVYWYQLIKLETIGMTVSHISTCLIVLKTLSYMFVLDVYVFISFCT